MSTELSLCPVCGHPLDPSACANCPLGNDCPIICCSYCGHTSVDASKSKLGSLTLSLLERADQHADSVALCDAPEGASVRVVSLDCTGKSRPLRLQAYGLAPGRTVRVLQQVPVTVVQAEHTELALEGQLAAQVQVEILSPTQATSTR